MNAQQLYRKSAAGSLTRIDMLLKLYAAAIETAEQGAKQIASTDKVAQETRIRMQRIVGLLVDGLDLSQGEVPAQVQRLLLFALQCSERDIHKEWTAMSRLFSTLHDGFVSIRAEAVAAERSGEIPPLAGQSRRETLSMHG
jgi:flagellin-specific chaperone FliS